MNTMGDFDHISLGLGLSLHEQKHKKKEHPSSTSSCNTTAYPYSLTLGLGSPENNQVANCTSTVVSSFSNSYTNNSIKRERYSEEHEPHDDEVEEKFPSRVDDDVNENSNFNRKKLRLTKEQSAHLEDTFKDHSTLNPKQKQELARKLNLRTRQVEVWFQNRRARTKLKQTEVECEELKKYYESLTEENKRLEEELKELKSIKTTTEQHNHLQLPVAGLTLCPSCKRICTGSGGGDNGSSHTTALLLGSKAQIHFYTNNKYTFTKSSASIAS